MTFTVRHAVHGRIDATQNDLGAPDAGLVWGDIHRPCRTCDRPPLTCLDCDHGMRAVQRNLPRHLRFFAHDPGRPDTCPRVGAGESEEHHLMKLLAAEAIRAVPGWRAELELSGGAEGDTWRADVMAMGPKGQRVAVEIQKSHQVASDTARRSDRYSRYGVECVWLMPSGSASLKQARSLGAVGYQLVTGDAFAVVDAYFLVPDAADVDRACRQYNLLSRHDLGAALYAATRIVSRTLPLDVFLSGRLGGDIRYQPGHEYATASDLDEIQKLRQYVYDLREALQAEAMRREAARLEEEARREAERREAALEAERQEAARREAERLEGIERDKRLAEEAARREAWLAEEAAKREERLAQEAARKRAAQEQEAQRQAAALATVRAKDKRAVAAALKKGSGWVTLDEVAMRESDSRGLPLQHWRGSVRLGSVLDQYLTAEEQEAVRTTGRLPRKSKRAA